MRLLYYFWLSPYCRKTLLVLAEKKLEHAVELERYWERRREFLALNPAGQVPTFVDDDGQVFADSQAICEYLDECFSDPPLFPGNAVERAEIRRLTAWFDQKFYKEVSSYLLQEKFLKRFTDAGAPEPAAIRAGLRNLGYHLNYIGYLVERRNWLAGDTFSLADITAAAHLSCIDYLGDIPWDANAAAKEWYARIKSRPSFRKILGEHVPGMPPPDHYADLDF